MPVLANIFQRFGAWVSPTLHLPVRVRAWPWLAVLSVLFVSACALDRERTVRALLNEWVVLGDAVFFKSTFNCTAAVYETRTTNVLSGAKKVRSIDRGLRLIDLESTVAFDVAALSPAQTYDLIDKASRMVSLPMLVSGLAAKDCFTDPLEAAYVVALNSPDAMLIYDPKNAALALFDRGGKQVFYTRAVIR